MPFESAVLPKYLKISSDSKTQDLKCLGKVMKKEVNIFTTTISSGRLNIELSVF